MASPQIITVASELDLNQAIAFVDSQSSGDYIIQFTADITEGTDTGGAITFNGNTLSAPADLYAINLQTTNVTVAIDGGGFTLSGDNAYRGLFIYSGAVNVSDLTLADMRAVGGAGGSGQSGGGGGAGLGGALFVAGATTAGGAGALTNEPGQAVLPVVTLDNVNFSNDKAIGGAGGRYLYGSSGGTCMAAAAALVVPAAARRSPAALRLVVVPVSMAVPSQFLCGWRRRHRCRCDGRQSWRRRASRLGSCSWRGGWRRRKHRWLRREQWRRWWRRHAGRRRRRHRGQCGRHGNVFRFPI